MSGRAVERSSQEGRDEAMRLKGRVAVVTGGARGIGRAVVDRFVEEGASVLVADVDEKSALQAVQEIRKKGGKAEPFAVDVRKWEPVQKMVDHAVKTFGRIDILINNAGVLRDNKIENISEEDWDFVLDVNLKGAFHCSKAVAPVMRAQNYGKIVSLASRAYLGNYGQANYSASKGGIVSLTRTLALEFAKNQINVNAVAPGLIDTPLTQGLRPDVRERLIKLLPFGRIGRVEEVANVVLFLSSDESSFVSGVCILVDGARSVGGATL